MESPHSHSHSHPHSQSQSKSQSQSQFVCRWYPPAFDIRLESVPIPTIQHPDDAIIKIKFAGLCGSDLHVYRGHEDVNETHICGHEFIGHVVALGSSFHSGSPPSRPVLYSYLKVGDKVISPFTVSCGECEYCRLGFTARCISSLLFGSPTLQGCQAQYVRVPLAGGTLFSLSTLSLPLDHPLSLPQELSSLPDPALLLLADILPTGLFVVLQACTHPKLAPIFTGIPWPHSLGHLTRDVLLKGCTLPFLSAAERILDVAIVGLGPVGLCATLALLDYLTRADVRYRIVAVDPNGSRRAKMQKIYDALPEDAKGKSADEFIVSDIPDVPKVVQAWGRRGCHAVLEVVGTPSALTLSVSLLAPSGVLSSCGVHQSPQIPFTGRELYDRNVSLEFGRCSAHSIFAAAVGLLLRRRDVLGAIGECSIIDRVIPLRDAVKAYEAFEKGVYGKVVFDPWA
ncbi:chaperonin 10-like protein [Multifurca ochricompacta]|uniref:Chaperonin 10-like protein n=1 Tax=Multifurca ochricompacta TaxID=376703 RepID=A0AAD4M3B1_9AGAM|nr:chaperonin 10-like protein [Multifurca ochricompacta]